MVNYINGNERHKSVVAEAAKELRERSTERLVANNMKEIENDVKTLVATFNEIRGRLAVALDRQKEIGGLLRGWLEARSKIVDRDFGAVLDEDCGEADDTDWNDAGVFMDRVKEIADKDGDLTRMRACSKANAGIARAIESWQSKIDKMKSVSVATGASENEVAVAERRIPQFEMAIVALRKRGTVVSEMYYASKRKIEGSIKRADGKFKAIFFNEKTGKEVK